MQPLRHDCITSIGLLILRLGIGGYMATHGWGKLAMIRAGEFAQFDPIGLGATLSSILIVFAELVCALLVMIGLGTRFAAVPIVFAMAVAAFVAHSGDPWTMQPIGPSKQPALMFLIPFLTLIFTGAGQFSIDELIRRRWRHRQPAPATSDAAKP